MRVIIAGLLLGTTLVSGCGGPDCDPPEYGSCTRDFEHHSARELSVMRWLVGHWRTEDARGRTHEQRWSPPTGGILLGFARVFRGDRDLGSEIRRIEKRREAITYVAHPEAAVPGVPFAFTDWAAARDGELRFVNPDNDFPTRITYRRVSDDEMLVRVENDERGYTLDFARVDGD